MLPSPQVPKARKALSLGGTGMMLGTQTGLRREEEVRKRQEEWRREGRGKKEAGTGGSGKRRQPEVRGHVESEGWGADRALPQTWVAFRSGLTALGTPPSVSQLETGDLTQTPGNQREGCHLCV